MIANDVTVQSGSFGVLEDDFFFKASVYARERGAQNVDLIKNLHHTTQLHLPPFMNSILHPCYFKSVLTCTFYS